MCRNNDIIRKVIDLINSQVEAPKPHITTIDELVKLHKSVKDDPLKSLTLDEVNELVETMRRKRIMDDIRNRPFPLYLEYY